jgi:hypothetical protein
MYLNGPKPIGASSMPLESWTKEDTPFYTIFSSSPFPLVSFNNSSLSLENFNMDEKKHNVLISFMFIVIVI